MTSYEQIQKVLDTLSACDNVEILLAAECSSRSWGYASNTSDHDVMFIYKPSLESHLNLFDEQGTIKESFNLEDGTEVTLTGWSLDKTLKLASTSNPSLMELVAVSKSQKHRTYADNEKLSTFLYDYIQEHYSSFRLMMCYLATAKHHLYTDYLRFPDDPKKQAKHAIAGFRFLLLAEHFMSQYNPLSNITTVIGSGFLSSCFTFRSPQWFEESSMLFDLRHSKEPSSRDLELFYDYLCTEEFRLSNIAKTLRCPAVSSERYKTLNDFFVETMLKS